MLGFDIGGTKCAVSLGHVEQGMLIVDEKRSMPTDFSITPYEMIDRMCETAEQMTKDFSRIGISCGGPLDSRRGVILSPPNLPGWDEVEIVAYLKARYGGRVSLQNDANACAIAEWKYGAGRGTKNMVFLTFGTGLGAGLILDGRLYAGSSDMAGEVGHVRMAEDGPIGYGKRGSLEGFCSGGGLAQIGRQIAEEALCRGETVSYCKSHEELAGITAKMLAEYADHGCADALRAFEICAEKLGLGLSMLIDILNPDAIVLGSVYVRAEHLLRERILQVIDREALLQARSVCRILPAGLGESLGDYAALSVASE